MSLRLLGTGSYLPENIMSNFDFEKIIDTSDEWIVTRTGISRRHFTDGIWNAEMVKNAAETALKEAGLKPEDLGAIIVATCTNEMGVPSVASQVQRLFDIEQCMAFDVNTACTGFMYALKIASSLIEGIGKPVLIAGSETLSRFMNFEDRASCVLFGDGCGAVIAEPGDNLKYIEVYSMPDYEHCIEITGMNTKEYGKHVPSYVSLKGQEVYKFATREVERVVNIALEKMGMTTDDIDWMVMHQANVRIIKSAAKRLGIPMEKCYVNIDETANTSAASIPIVLDEMNKKEFFKKGDKLMFVGFGGGLTSGCAVYEW